MMQLINDTTPEGSSALDSFVLRRMQHAALGRWQQTQTPQAGEQQQQEIEDASSSSSSSRDHDEEVKEDIQSSGVAVVVDQQQQEQHIEQPKPQATTVSGPLRVSRGRAATRRTSRLVVAASPPVTTTANSVASTTIGRPHVGPRQQPGGGKAVFRDILDEDWLGADSDEEGDCGDCSFHQSSAGSSNKSFAGTPASPFVRSGSRSLSPSSTRRMKVRAYAA